MIFISLFGTSISPQERGKKLEIVLNDLFDAYGILIQEAFHLVGGAGRRHRRTNRRCH